jgi:hypothetical protein
MEPLLLFKPPVFDIDQPKEEFDYSQSIPEVNILDFITKKSTSPVSPTAQVSKLLTQTV